MLTYLNFLKTYPNILKIDPKFPDNINITTITLLINLNNIRFNTKEIAEHIKINKNFINIIKYGNSVNNFRSIFKEKERKKNDKKRQNFYFQTTLKIINKINNIKLNLKLFRNGNIQITGAKNISSVLWSVYKIFKLLICAENKTSIELYTKQEGVINLKDIDKIKIVMINCVIKFDYKINRNELYKKLYNDKYDVFYDSSRHAGVNLKYYDLDNNLEINNSKYINRYVSMLIFEKGNVIFSGAINYKDIIICYKFLIIYLIDNYDMILRIKD